MVQQFKETGHPIFIGTSALNRGVLKRRQNKSTIHFNRESTNTELLFHTIHSATQLFIHGAATNWCFSSAWRMKRKDQMQFLWTVKCWSLWSQKMLNGSPHTQAPGDREQGHSSFRVLEKRVQMTQLCEKASFQYLVTGGKYYQIQLDGKDGWGEITFLCCEYTISRVFKESEVRLAILTGTLIGPVGEVHVVETLGEYGIEVGVPSIWNPLDTSFVVISRETGSFVNELHQLKREFRSSNELLKEESKEERVCLTKREK